MVHKYFTNLAAGRGLYTPDLKEWSVRKLAVVHKALKLSALQTTENNAY